MIIEGEVGAPEETSTTVVHNVNHANNSVTSHHQAKKYSKANQSRDFITSLTVLVRAKLE